MKLDFSNINLCFLILFIFRPGYLLTAPRPLGLISFSPLPFHALYNLIPITRPLCDPLKFFQAKCLAQKWFLCPRKNIFHRIALPEGLLLKQKTDITQDKKYNYDQCMLISSCHMFMLFHSLPESAQPQSALQPCPKPSLEWLPKPSLEWLVWCWNFQKTLMDNLPEHSIQPSLLALFKINYMT